MLDNIMLFSLRAVSRDEFVELAMRLGAKDVTWKSDSPRFVIEKRTGEIVWLQLAPVSDHGLGGRRGLRRVNKALGQRPETFINIEVGRPPGCQLLAADVARELLRRFSGVVLSAVQRKAITAGELADMADDPSPLFQDGR